MAIRKLPSGRFQARLQDRDGAVLSQTFETREDAEIQVSRWKQEKKQGKALARSRKLTVSQFFDEWFVQLPARSNSGWRKTQKQLFRDFAEPVIGRMSLWEVTPADIQATLKRVETSGRSRQVQRHVYNTLRKMFGDAIELYRYLTFNPANKKLRPPLTVSEAPHLNLEQARRLLAETDPKKGKRYGLAVWVQLYLGLRVGELQALRWEDLDLEEGRIHIRRTYVGKVGEFRNYPKGEKHHSASIPTELLASLREASGRKAGVLVCPSPANPGGVLPYKWYRKALKKYCRAAGVPEIGTHGLRHSTAELYMAHQANRDDLRQLFAHSSLDVTDRYIHGRGTNLERVAKVIRLFDEVEPTTKVDHAKGSA